MRADSHTGKHTFIWTTGRPANLQADRPTNIYRQAGRQADGQPCMQAVMQGVIHAGTQVGRQADWQSYTHASNTGKEAKTHSGRHAGK